MRFIDLFAGIGGFRVALEARGHQCVFSSEIDKHARKAYSEQFGDEPAGDITEIDERDIPAHDILCGGFPCKSFSNAGRMKGFVGKEGRLFFEIVRIAKHHKPRILLLENVPAILSERMAGCMRDIRDELDKIGYTLTLSLLNASYFGVPQCRKRVYFVGLRKDAGLWFKLPRPTYEEIYLQDVLEKEVDEKLYLERDDFKFKELKPSDLCLLRCGHYAGGGEGQIVYQANGHAKTQKSVSAGYNSTVLYFIPSLAPIRLGHFALGGCASRIYHIAGHAIAQTHKAGTGQYLVSGRIRKLSILESKRVMGFADNHVVSAGAQGYKQLGNAVIPRMVGVVFDSVKETRT